MKKTMLLTLLFIIFYLPQFGQNRVVIQNKKHLRREKLLDVVRLYNIVTKTSVYNNFNIIKFKDSILTIRCNPFNEGLYSDTTKIHIRDIQKIEYYWFNNQRIVHLPITAAFLGILVGAVGIPLELINDSSRNAKEIAIGVAGMEAASTLTYYILTRKRKFDMVNKWLFKMK